jgi:hypothetical protein
MQLPYSRLQAVVGLLAGIASLAGAVWSGVGYFTAPKVGELAAVVHETRTDRPLRDATIEVLTPRDALVTTLAPAADGWIHYPLREGSYRVRVTHAQLGTETRAVEVHRGETAEVRFELGPTVSMASAPARRSRRGPGPVSRFLGRLGL